MKRTGRRCPQRRYDEDYILPLDRDNTRTIDRTGGTCAAHLAHEPSKMKAGPTARLPGRGPGGQHGDDGGRYDLTPVVLDNIEYLGLDYLVTIGGDDTLSYSKILDRAGVPVIAIPKTMDNDVQGTEYCIGFSTAITRAKEAINRQRTTLGSHERIGVFRIFGRDAGFSALYTAYVVSGRCVIPEAPFDLDKLIDVLVEDKRSNPSRYAFVIASRARCGTAASCTSSASRRLRPQTQGGRRLRAGRGDQAEDRRGRGERRADLRPARRRARFDRPDGRDHVRQHRGRPDPRRRQPRPDGGHRRRQVRALPSPSPTPGPRKVDVQSMYDVERYRPIYTNRAGLPLLLGIPVPEDPSLMAR